MTASNAIDALKPTVLYVRARTAAGERGFFKVAHPCNYNGGLSHAANHLGLTIPPPAPVPQHGKFIWI